jgi:hypothetical protein
MGTRVWAQEKLEAARARLMSAKASKASAAAAQDTLARRQNKDAVLAEAAVLNHGGQSVAENHDKHAELVRKATSLVAKGLLDPGVPQELEKDRLEAIRFT